MVEELIPIVMFISLAVVLIFLFWFRFRSRESVNETLRRALDKGQELTPELVEQLGHSSGGKYRDLRLGIIWISISIGLALVAFGVGEFAVEALQGTLASAALPFAIGLGYLLIYWLTGKDEE